MGRAWFNDLQKKVENAAPAPVSGSVAEEPSAPAPAPVAEESPAPAVNAVTREEIAEILKSMNGQNNPDASSTSELSPDAADFLSKMNDTDGYTEAQRHLINQALLENPVAQKLSEDVRMLKSHVEAQNRKRVDEFKFGIEQIEKQTGKKIADTNVRKILKIVSDEDFDGTTVAEAYGMVMKDMSALKKETPAEPPPPSTPLANSRNSESTLPPTSDPREAARRVAKKYQASGHGDSVPEWLQLS